MKYQFLHFWAIFCVRLPSQNFQQPVSFKPLKFSLKIGSYTFPYWSDKYIM